MRFRHGWMRVVTAGVVAALTVSGASAGAAAEPSGPVTAEEYGGVTPAGEVTLVTGDVVAVGVEPDGRLSAEVTRPAARPDDSTVLFSTVREQDSLCLYRPTPWAGT